jgi:putative ABC transport system substrate-binding protein
VKRRDFIALLGGARRLRGRRVSARSNQANVWRIGFLAVHSCSTASNPDDYYEAFAQGMRELGCVEGKNLGIERRFAEGKYERLPSLAAELVRMRLEGPRNSEDRDLAGPRGDSGVRALRLPDTRRRNA